MWRKDLVDLGARVSLLDQAVFFKSDQGQLSGAMVLHVDDTLWIGDEYFSATVIEPLKSKFLISSEEHHNMRYLGLAISGDSDSIKLDLNHYTHQIAELEINADRAKDDTLSGGEASKLRIVSGQLNWISTQCRPDIGFNSCQIACSLKTAKVSDAKFANKTIRGRASKLQKNGLLFAFCS